MATLTSTFPTSHLGDSISSRWDRWWFAPALPFNLGLCRLMFFGLLFWFQLDNHFSGWPTLPASFLTTKISLFKTLHLPIFSSQTVLMLEIAWKISLAMACIGLFTRISAFLSFVLGVYLVGLTYNYGKTDHMTAMFLFTSGILALSRCGDAVSVDRLIRARRNPAPVPPSGEYRWPVRMIWVLMSVIFFAAGMAKVVHGGAQWVFSENFAMLLVQRHYTTSPPALSWGLFIAKYPLLYQGAAAGTMVLELFMFVALFSKKLRLVLPWMLLGMQIGIGLLMRVWFTPYMFVYLFWIPWDKVLDALTGRRHAQAEWSAA